MENLENIVFAELAQMLTTDTIVVAVSGGADSMALTILAKKYTDFNKKKLIAVTIDHQLRIESSTEAMLVAQILRPYEIEHHILKWEHSDNLNRRHERARKARYDLLLEYCHGFENAALMTAHHQQDQVETILMRFLKGSGPAGFKGIQRLRWQQGVAIFRPLLKVSPKDLRDYLVARNIGWVEDPSNCDEKYERTRIRALVGEISKDWGQGGILDSAVKISLQAEIFEKMVKNYAVEFVVDQSPLSVEQEKFLKCPIAVQIAWLRQQIWQTGRAAYPKPETTITAILAMLKQPLVNGYKVAGCVIHVAKGKIVLLKN